MNNTDIVKNIYAAFGRGDLPAILNVLDPQIEWEHPGPKEIPWAGSFRGHDGVTKFFVALSTEAEVKTFEPRAFVAEGDNVVVLGWEKIAGKRSGRAYENHWAHWWTLRGGKVVKFREYNDTAAIASVFQNTPAGNRA